MEDLDKSQQNERKLQNKLMKLFQPHLDKEI